MVGRRERRAVVPDFSAPRFDRGAHVQEEDIFEGEFTIEAFDSISHELVWRGSARVEEEPGTVVDEELLHRAVNDVLDPLPQQ